MAKILSNERVVEYSTEFKVRVVKLTESLDVTTADIAEIMGLHPVMVYRWRQEYREGKIIEQPSRRISMVRPEFTRHFSGSENTVVHTH
jgi:transposase